jgi:hypothetical protein
VLANGTGTSGIAFWDPLQTAHFRSSPGLLAAIVPVVAAVTCGELDVGGTCTLQWVNVSASRPLLGTEYRLESRL